MQASVRVNLAAWAVLTGILALGARAGDAGEGFSLSADKDTLAANEGKTFEGYVAIPARLRKKSEIPVPLEKNFPFGKYAHYMVNDDCFIVIAYYGHDKLINEQAQPGRVFYLKGTLSKFVDGKERVGDDIMNRNRFCVEASCLEPKYELSQPTGKFDAKTYPLVTPEQICANLRNDAKINKKFCFDTVYGSRLEIPGALKDAHDLDPAAYCMVSHKKNGNQPLLLVPRTVNVDDNFFKTVKDGDPVRVCGRIYLTVLKDLELPLLLVDGLALSDKKELAADPEPENSDPGNSDYQRVDKKLLGIAIGGICDGTLAASYKTGKNLEIALVYRGIERADDALVADIPPLAGKRCMKLNSGDNDLPDSIVIVMPRENRETREKIRNLENGDTVLLQCRAGKMKDERYYLEVCGATLPSPQ